MDATAAMAQDDRIARLAQQLGSLTRKDEHRLLKEAEIVDLRRKGACELHSICSEFVASVNRLLSPAVLELTPPEYAPEIFRASGVNLIQINAQGRIIQIAFEATRELVSTERFRTPYILEGEVRTYNQEMLERVQIHSQALFFCVEESKTAWRYFEWRRGSTGVFNRELLVTLLERLV